MSNDVLELYNKLFLPREDDHIHDGQEYVYHLMFNSHGRTAITDKHHWDRRHIRAVGAYKTLCYTGCSVRRSDWALYPREDAYVDVCPDCRAMADYYHEKGYPVRLEHSDDHKREPEGKSE